jgi:dipeptidyl aminopeptidase/acylaminoacyl peptidase
MKKVSLAGAMFSIFFLSVVPALTAQDMQKGWELDAMYQMYEETQGLTNGVVLHGAIDPQWIGETGVFWYNVLAESGTEYYLVDAAKQDRRLAFNLNDLSARLTGILGVKVEPVSSSITQLRFSNDLSGVTFVAGGYRFSWSFADDKLEKGELAQPRSQEGWSMQRRNELAGRPVESPDKKREAFIMNYNIFVREKSTQKVTQLSFDGGIGLYYSSFIRWSPDSRFLMSTLVRPTEEHMVHYIESSPADQLQPRHTSIQYYKPGDALQQYYPRIFSIDGARMVAECDSMIPNQYSLDRFEWRSDSRALSFEYNKRGHQLYQVIEMDPVTGRSRVLIEEASKTFIDYSGKRYRMDLNDGKEILWASERDGWNHLFLFDGQTGKLKNQVTRGEWVVREVLKVDPDKRTIIFLAGGKEKGDPYLQHLYRINFDGTGLTRLSQGDGNHRVSFSPDGSYFVDSWSRVDMPPVTVLRESEKGKEIMVLEKADISRLLKTGWTAPEVFVTKGRDGKTDIWGMIMKPAGFDPEKKYPVIEYIYSGPHSSHVPKDFSEYYNRCRQSLTSMGFVIVMIDGMGTSNRSKAFHDVCWKNIGDAGFPDRIIWIKDAAAKRPWMDIRKVGIYGKSAGGQNAAGAVLFHPEFYKVAVAVCGCHDNRMDKIWWNEQWMGWPVGKEYSESSNVDNAWRLQGDLFLIVGEMDQNVDPSSTYQVVDALIKANKDFDYLMLPGKGHEWGGQYGERRIVDYFVDKIMGVTPPPMNSRDFGYSLITKDIDR